MGKNPPSKMLVRKLKRFVRNLRQPFHKMDTKQWDAASNEALRYFDGQLDE